MLISLIGAFIFTLVACLGDEPNYQLQQVVSGLNQPVQVTTAPGDSNLYIVEQRGRVLVQRAGGLETFLDIRDRVRSGGERGLLSIAFHPNYDSTASPNQGRFFVNYTAEREVPGQRPRLYTVISEFVNGSDTETKLLEIFQPYGNHNGGQIAFGPDGYLYIGMGDGGSAGDPRGYSQNPMSLLGKMLRIDVDGEKPYAIPNGNMYSDPSEGRAEIYAIGLRNPWRFSFDSESKRLFAGDVGQGRLEYIHLIEAGKNYGWNVMEGSLCFRPSSGCDKTGLELPIHEYDRNSGYSITGGHVYHGATLGDLKGSYIFGDFGSGKIWSLSQQDGSWNSKLLLDSGLSISAFGEGANKELLIVDHSGSIYQLKI